MLIWVVTLNSVAASIPVWSHRFTSRPTPNDLVDALRQDSQSDDRAEAVASLEIFIDLATRLPEDFTRREIRIITAAQVRIGSVFVLKESLDKRPQ